MLQGGLQDFKIHQGQVGGDEMLHCGVVQFLCDLSTFFLVGPRHALRNLFGLALQFLARRDVCNDTQEPRWVAGDSELAVYLQPAA